MQAHVQDPGGSVTKEQVTLWLYTLFRTLCEPGNASAHLPPPNFPLLANE